MRARVVVYRMDTIKAGVTNPGHHWSAYDVCPAIAAGGVGTANHSHYWLEIENDGEKRRERMKQNTLFGKVEVQRDFATVTKKLETQYQCPACGYEWSGKPRSDAGDAPKRNSLFEKKPKNAKPDYACPKCHHEWSGKPRVGTASFGGGSGLRVVVRKEEAKPEYRVPTMREIAKIPWNGFNVVSTFSGCGGSSLGYKLAGFRVLWASEFVPAARETYQANFPKTIVDPRDIREVKPEDILKATGLKKGELDLLDGSPPCFGAGTPVLTKRGIIPIEQITKGDFVITHEGRWKRVVGTSSRKAPTIILEDRVEVTRDHLFLARERSAKRNLTLEEVGWKSAGKIQGSFCATPTKFPFERPPAAPEGFEYGEDFWYFVGRWLGDGWLRMQKSDREGVVGSGKPLHSEPVPCRQCGEPSYEIPRFSAKRFSSYCSPHCRMIHKNRRQKPRWGVNVCASFPEAPDLKRKLERLGVPVGESTVQHTRRFTIGRKSLASWLLLNFGQHAAGKTLPSWALGMRRDWREAIFNGYVDADGSRGERGKIHAGTVSRCLATGMTLLAGTLGYTTSFLARKTANDVICGRKIKTRQSYTLGFSPDDGRYTRIDEIGRRWRKMRRSARPGKKLTTVYDIEVEDDHSFLADTFLVHNCASFSTAGKREKHWGSVKKYSDTVQRTDDLFFEYVRLLKGLQPKAFVAENVSGLVKGSAKGYFKMILSALEECGYRVAVKVLDAQWLGVPQMRQRVIYVGVRNDLGLDPAHPLPLPYNYSVAEALPCLRHLVKDPKKARAFDAELSLSKPAPTLCATAEGGSYQGVEAEFAVGAEKDTQGQFGREDETHRPAFTPTAMGTGQQFVKFVRVKKAELASLLKGAVGTEWDKLKPGEQSDKYFNLVRPDPGSPSPAVTAIGGSGAASVTHPIERRKFTIEELKLICGFPSDFELGSDDGKPFKSSYASRWERLGRAVPPPMMMRVASTVRDEILAPASKMKAKGKPR